MAALLRLVRSINSTVEEDNMPPEFSNNGVESQFLKQGGALLYLLALLYILLALYQLAQHFLLPAFDLLVARTAATPSVAGALILPAILAVPDIIMSIVSVFIAVGNESVSKYYGVHLYGLTALVALAILFVPKNDLKPVAFKPALRDIAAVILAFAVFLLFSADGEWLAWEMALLLVLFLLYLLAVRALRRWLGTVRVAGESHELEAESGGKGGAYIEGGGGNEGDETEEEKPSSCGQTWLAAPPRLGWESGSSVGTKAIHLVCLPVLMLLKVTVPPPACLACTGRLYPLTLLLVFLWEALLGWAATSLASPLGRALGLPSLITGVVIMAPLNIDFVLCILLGRRGDLAVVVHFLLGRAILHTTLETGLPNLLFNIVFASPVHVKSDGALGGLVLLLIVILHLLLMLGISKGRLNKMWAIPFLLMFLFYFFVIVVVEYSIIVLPF